MSAVVKHLAISSQRRAVPPKNKQRQCQRHQLHHDCIEKSSGRPVVCFPSTTGQIKYKNICSIELGVKWIWRTAVNTFAWLNTAQLEMLTGALNNTSLDNS